MSADDSKRAYRKDLLLASALVTAGLVMSGMSLVLIAHHPQEMAQATQPLQPSPPDDQNKPAESKPGGERPTTPPPEPAHPDPQAQKGGAKPALPVAPAEKIGPPIKEK